MLPDGVGTNWYINGSTAQANGHATANNPNGNVLYMRYRRDLNNGTYEEIIAPAYNSSNIEQGINGWTPNNNAPLGLYASSSWTDSDPYAEWAAQNPEKAYNPDLINTEWTDDGTRVNGQIEWERVYNGVIQHFVSGSKPSNTGQIDTGSGNNVTKEPTTTTTSHKDTRKLILHYWAMGTLTLSATRLVSELNNSMANVTQWVVDSVEINKEQKTITAYLCNYKKTESQQVESGSGEIFAIVAIAAAVAALAIFGIFVTKYEIRKIDDALVSQQITSKEALINLGVKSGMSLADAVALANEAYGKVVTPNSEDGKTILGIPTEDIKYAAIGLFALVALGMLKDITKK